VKAQIRYTRSGDVNTAYQVTGAGPFDLVLVPGFFSHLELDGEHPDHARFLLRLGSFARLIRFDKRGTGLSDRAVGLPDFEARMDDVRAVMDAAESERAALFGYSEGGPLSVLFAATYPERAAALVLYGTYAKRIRSDDYPWAPTWAERVRVAEGLERTWGENVDLSTMIPNADAATAEWFHRRGRAALSPAAARDLILMNSKADVRELLPMIQCPTLVLHRTGDRDSLAAEGRYISEQIPGARFVELSGDDHVPWIRPDEVLDPVEEFLTGTRPVAAADRVLATILFTDLVESTTSVRDLGDAAWASLLARHAGCTRRSGERVIGSEHASLPLGQRRASRARGRRRSAARRRPARRPRPARDEAGMRRGRVRGVRGAARRPAGSVVHRARRGS
jgi:pimeloyl-ACP methyl ester carboxylesterase